MIKNHLSALKKIRGRRILFFRNLGQTTNVLTGAVTTNFDITIIRKAIVQNPDTYLFNIMQGGEQILEAQEIIIALKDYDYEITMNDHIEFDKKRYNIKIINKDDYAFHLVCVNIAGDTTVGRRLSVTSTLTLTQDNEALVQ